MNSTLNPETETKWTETKAWIDGLPAEGKTTLLHLLKERLREAEARKVLATMTPEQMSLAQDEAFREGQKDAVEDLFSGWEFEPTLFCLRDNLPPLTKEVQDRRLYRYATDEELDEVHHPGKTLRFPVRWTMDGPVYETYSLSQTEWDAGKRWTFGKVWTLAKSVYRKNKGKAVKEMGDHQFWEGISLDGTVMMGS